MNLILFTASFPYVRGGDANFLSVEIKYLSKTFERVIVVPENIKASKLPEYADLEVDTSYAELLASKNNLGLLLLALSSKTLPHGFKEARFPFFSLDAWRRLFAFSGKAELIRRWTQDFIYRKKITPNETLFYTYWFDNAAAGIGMVKMETPDFRLVSRAHNYDIYVEKYYSPPFFPGRDFALNSVDQLFPCSLDGLEYMKARYSKYASRFQPALLGVVDSGFICQASTDGVFRIVSCSFLRPEKRVSLIFESLKLAAEKRPQQRFEWHHIGNGEERENLQKIADKSLPVNAKAVFMEYVDNGELMRYYHDNPVDVFINASSTEGIPVSIMEVASCGIPVIATNVGGNREIVSEENGILLSDNPSSSEIATAFFHFLDHPNEAAEKRSNSRKIWDAHFNAKSNFSKFAEILKRIRQGD